MIFAAAVSACTFNITQYLIEEHNFDKNSIDNDEVFKGIVGKQEYQMIDYLVIGNDQYKNWCLKQAWKLAKFDVMKYIIDHHHDDDDDEKSNVDKDSIVNDNFSYIAFEEIVNGKKYDLIDYLVCGNGECEKYCLSVAVALADFEIIKYLIEEANVNKDVITDISEDVMADIDRDYKEKQNIVIEENDFMKVSQIHKMDHMMKYRVGVEMSGCLWFGKVVNEKEI